METISATQVRKTWSETCDSAARVRPAFIKRTRDVFMLVNSNDLIKLLRYVNYHAKVLKEKEGVTLSLEEMDLVVHAETEDAALTKMASDILEYAEEYYDNYSLYSASPNRAEHAPYIIKALLLDDVEKIKGEIECREG